MKLIKKNLTPMGKMMCKVVGWKETKKFIEFLIKKEDKEILNRLKNSFKINYTKKGLPKFGGRQIKNVIY